MFGSLLQILGSLPVIFRNLRAIFKNVRISSGDLRHSSVIFGSPGSLRYLSEYFKQTSEIFVVIFIGVTCTFCIACSRLRESGERNQCKVDVEKNWERTGERTFVLALVVSRFFPRPLRIDFFSHYLGAWNRLLFALVLHLSYTFLTQSNCFLATT